MDNAELKSRLSDIRDRVRNAAVSPVLSNKDISDLVLDIDFLIERGEEEPREKDDGEFFFFLSSSFEEGHPESISGRKVLGTPFEWRGILFNAQITKYLGQVDEALMDFVDRIILGDSRLAPGGKCQGIILGGALPTWLSFGLASLLASKGFSCYFLGRPGGPEKLVPAKWPFTE